MAKRSKKEEARREAWWNRSAWPVAVLGIDPGNQVTGAALYIPHVQHIGGGVDTLKPHLERTWSTDPFTRNIEAILLESARRANDHSLKLVLGIETWGRGGPLGLSSWIGLGAARGYWKRAALLLHDELGAESPFVKARMFVDINMRTWRSYVHEEHGERSAHGVWKAFDEEGWKRAATRRHADLFPTHRLTTADEAEASLIGYYATRCDEVGKTIPKRDLKAFGIEAPGKS